MKNLLTIVIFFCLGLSLQGQGLNRDTTEFITYQSANYTVQYPSSWTLDTTKQFGAEFFIFSPLENEDDKFRENVNMMIQDLTGQNIDLEKYKEITEKQVREIVTAGEIFESAITTRNERTYYIITYAMTQNQRRLKFTSICFIVNEKSYLATFSSELAKYEQYKQTANQILASFKLVR